MGVSRTRKTHRLTARPAAFSGAGGGWLRTLSAFVIGAVCLGLVWSKLEGIDFDSVRQALATVSAAQWGLALIATAVSFWALGRYDAVAHRHFGTGIADASAQAAGAVAIALSQTLGLGLLTSALARWRMLRLPAGRVLQVTAFVTLSFTAAWAIVTTFVTLFLGGPVPLWLSVLTMPLTALALTAMFFYPALRLRGRAITFPSLPAATTILAMTILDTFAAAAALWLLLPPDLAVPYATLLPVYLVALGAALLSGTPGGLGPFELTLLALLAPADPAKLLAGLVAFRLVYYALPAAVAIAVLLHPPAWTRRARPSRDVPIASELGRGLEPALAHQNGGMLVDHGTGVALSVSLPQTEVLLGDPATGPLPLRWLSDRARAGNRVPAAYKITARNASTARRAGWHVLRIAEEAIVAPADHDLSSPAHRQLRRKLRKAEKAGLRIEHRPARHLPLDRMRDVHAAWQAANGPERGFSMGRFSPDHLARQTVLLAWIDEELLAFASFHGCNSGLYLDLMRIRPGAPDGTMHSLMQRGIEIAADRDLPQVSLAAVPSRNPATGRFDAVMRRMIYGPTGGLTQFKAAFGPRWQPLYATAPGRRTLVLALGDIAREIHRPAPLDQAPPRFEAAEVTAMGDEIGTGAHQDVEDYEVAYKSAS